MEGVGGTRQRKVPPGPRGASRVFPELRATMGRWSRQLRSPPCALPEWPDIPPKRLFCNQLRSN